MPSNPSISDRNIKKLSQSQTEELLGRVNKEINESEQTLSAWKHNINTYYELYGMVQRKKNYEGLANIFVPEILRAVETIVAKLYNMITGQPDWFQYIGRDNNMDTGPALAMTQLVDYQMAENGFKARLMDSLRQMVITGLTVRKVLWDYETVKRQKTSMVEGLLSSSDYIETIKDTWTYEAVDLLTFHISDINIPYNELQKAVWIAEQFTVNKHWIRERVRRGWFAPADVAAMEEESASVSSQAQTLNESRISSSGFSYVPTKGKFEVIERWGLIEAELVLSQEEMDEQGYDPDDFIESVIVIANKRHILKLEKNPFGHNQKPYLACPYVPKEFQLPGMGVTQIGESLQEEINDTRNQTMDNKTLVLMTMWLKTRGSGIKNDQLRIRPNGIITTNDIQGLVPLRPPIVAGIGTNMEGIAKNDLRESVGAASNLQGIAQAGVGTATESSIINKESIGRLMLTAELYAELMLKPMLILAEYLNYQFYDHVKVIKVVGTNGVKYRQLKPEEIAGNKDVIIKISVDSAENPAVMRQQAMNFLSIVQPMMPQQLEFHWKLLDKIYGMFFNGHDLSELYPAPPNPEDLLQPQDERDCVLAEQKVVAQKGQDHSKYIEYHTKEFDSMKHSMNQQQFDLYKNLIKSHYQMLQQEIQEQHQAMIAQQAMFMGGNGAPAGAHGGDRRNPNTSAHTMTNAPSASSLRQGIGG